MKKKLLALGLAMMLLIGTLTVSGKVFGTTDPPFGMEMTDIKTL